MSSIPRANVKFSIAGNETEVTSSLQSHFDSVLNNMKPLSINSIAGMLDELEFNMDSIDQAREKHIFIRRLRNEWIDSFIKRYVQKGGELGAQLSKDE